MKVINRRRPLRANEPTDQIEAAPQLVLFEISIHELGPKACPHGGVPTAFHFDDHDEAIKLRILSGNGGFDYDIGPCTAPWLDFTVGNHTSARAEVVDQPTHYIIRKRFLVLGAKVGAS